MEALRVMELLTIVFTLLMMMSGIPPCMNMYKSGSTKNVPFLIFLLSVISSLGMFLYGVRIESGTIIFLNAIGTILNTSFVLLYLFVTENKAKYMGYTTASIIYLLALAAYIRSGVLSEKEATQLLGSSSSTVVTLLVMVPVLEIVNNIRFKNADGMPTVMLFGALASGVCWLVYGLMLQDPNVYTPNIPGIAICVAKLGIVALYGQEKSKAE